MRPLTPQKAETIPTKHTQTLTDLSMKLFLITLFFAFLPLSKSSGQGKLNFKYLTSPSSITAEAEKWQGRHFRYGQSRQCANWVGEVVRVSGYNTPSNPALARNWLSWGRRVPSLAAIRPGDLVITWRGSKHGSSGHILIYLGDGMCIHRPTQSRAVCKTELTHYKSKLLGVRRKTNRD
jgi:cell wall-associated NlpC family hydrolase